MLVNRFPRRVSMKLEKQKLNLKIQFSSFLVKMKSLKTFAKTLKNFGKLEKFLKFF